MCTIQNTLKNTITCLGVTVFTVGCVSSENTASLQPRLIKETVTRLFKQDPAVSWFSRRNFKSQRQTHARMRFKNAVRSLAHVSFSCHQTVNSVMELAQLTGDFCSWHTNKKHCLLHARTSFPDCKDDRTSRYVTSEQMLMDGICF